MIDHMDDGLGAAIKALDEVVGPAIDTSNPLAVEQLRLVSRFLGFVRSRGPLNHERLHHELRHYIALATQLAGMAPANLEVPAQEILEQAVKTASPLASDPRATSAQLQRSIDSLSSAVSTLVRLVATAPAAVRDPVERTVVRASQSLLNTQRAWFLPMGFEPDPGRVPALGSALAEDR
jgi:hypothetical protein